MSKASTFAALIAIGLLAGGAVSRGAAAQGTVVPGEGPGQRQPTPGDPHRTIPEEIEKAPVGGSEKVPQANSPKEGETLSERLDRSHGVIKPPTGIDPEIKVPAPVPNPNSTPVIPPPGSPGNPSPVQPK